MLVAAWLVSFGSLSPGQVTSGPPDPARLEALAAARDPTLEAEATALLEDALAQGDRAREALALLHLAQAELLHGRLAGAMQNAERAEALFAALGDTFEVGRARRRQGDVYSQLEDAAQAVERFTSAGAAFRAAAGRTAQADIDRQLAHLDAAIGNALRERSPEVAREHYQEALRRYDSIGYAAGVDGMRANLGTVLQTLGDLDGADAMFAAAEQGARARADRYLLSILLANRSALAWRRGRHQQALDLGQASLELAQEDRRRNGMLTAWLRIAQAQRGLGMAGQAEASLRQAIGRFGKDPPPELAAEILGEQIALLKARGAVAEALQLAERRGELQAGRKDDRALAFWRARFDSERKDAEIQRLADERRQQSLLAGAASLVALLSLALLAALLARHRLALAARRREQAQHRRLEAALASVERLSNTDALTGLSNRRAAESWWNEKDAPGQVLALADIDHFKTINDQHGHEAGDRVLERAARVLAAAVDGQGLAARWGGEEFLLVFASETAARTALQGLRKQLAEPAPGTADLTLTLTVGATRIAPEERLADVLRRADRALYRGKAEGRDRVVWAEDRNPDSG